MASERPMTPGPAGVSASDSMLEVPHALGQFDVLHHRPPSLTGAGWMLNTQRSLDRIEIRWNGRPVGDVNRTPRADVLEANPTVAHSGESGFSFDLQVDNEAPGRIDLVGYCGDAAVARLSTVVPRPEDAELALPPGPLMQKVSGVSSDELFVMHGLRMFTEIVDLLVKHKLPEQSEKLLDWGCGCGRATRYFLSRNVFSEVCGCDIDPEVIDWCQNNLPNGTFDLIQPSPSLPYADRSFDAVVACSVLTHIRGRDQGPWLEEVRRVLKPGGLFIASTLGEHAYQFTRSRKGRSRRRRLRLFLSRWLGPSRLVGIEDGRPGRVYKPISKGSYYKGVYQSKSHTMQQWGQQFEILQYLDRGLNNYQDLVVMRRK